jgi:hypothetical protein
MPKSKIPYKKGDFVRIKSAKTKAKFIIGEIKSINETIQTFEYEKLIFPEDTVQGKLPYNSKYEIYQTSQTEKATLTNIISKCYVYFFNDYVKLKSQKELKENSFFYRQRYDSTDNSFFPDLDTMCYCKKIFNLDDDEDFVFCDKCGELMHKECFLKNESKKCSADLCNNDLMKKYLNIINKNNNNNSNNMNSNNNINNNTNNKLLGKKHDREENTNKNEEKYLNLPPENKSFLINLIDKLEKESNLVVSNQSEDEKSRTNATNRIFFSLLYGIEELKIASDSFWENEGKNEIFNKNNIKDNEETQKYCKKLAKEIESRIYLKNKSVITNNYKKKLFQLYSNLNDSKNEELRFNVLLKKFSPERLVDMTSDELISKAEKLQRVNQQNKFFKEQVYVPEDMKIIAINHKDNILSQNNRDKINTINPLELLEEQNKIDEFSDEEINEKNNNFGGIKKNKNLRNEQMKEIKSKYSNLSSDMIKFYFELNQFKNEYYVKKFNEKIKTLKEETQKELNEIREKYKNIDLNK